MQQLSLQPRSQGPLSSSLEKVLSRGRKREDPGYEVATFTSRREKYIFRGTGSDAHFFNGQVPKR